MTDPASAAREPGLGGVIVPVTAFQQNCGIFWCGATGSAVITDPGGDADAILAAFDEASAKHGLTLCAILLTHGHIDHVGAAVEISEARGVAIEGPHEADRPLLEALPRQASMFGVETVRVPEPARWLSEGDSVTFGEITWEVRHAPGHAPGHVIFVDHTHRFVVMGDVLFNGSIGRTDLPGGDMPTLMASIRDKVLTLPDETSFVCGHGPGSTVGAERRANPFLKALD